LDSQEELDLLFNLDLDGNYTELQYRHFLYIYRKKFREIHALNCRTKDEKIYKEREVKKLQDELKKVEQKLHISMQENFLLNKKIDSKLSFKERITGKIKRS